MIFYCKTKKKKETWINWQMFLTLYATTYSTNRKLSYCVSSLSFQIFCVYFMIQEQEDLKELGKTEFASSEQIDL